jgi:hypothetical protein
MVGAALCAQNQEVDVKALLRRIEELEQKVKALGSRSWFPMPTELDKSEDTGRNGRTGRKRRPKGKPRSAGADGLVFSSADKDFSLRLRGDCRDRMADDGGIVGKTLLLRAAISIEAKVFAISTFLPRGF